MNRFQKTLLAAGVLVAVGTNIASHKAGAAPAFLRVAPLHDTAYAKGDSSNAKAAAQFLASKLDRFGRAMKMLSTLKRISGECERQKTTVFDSVTIAKKWIGGFRLAKEDLAAHLKAHPNDARARKELAKVQGMLDGIPDALVGAGLRQIGIVYSDSTGEIIWRARTIYVDSYLWKSYKPEIEAGIALLELAHSMQPDDLRMKWWLLLAYESGENPEKVIKVANSLFGKSKPIHGPGRQIIDYYMEDGDCHLLQKRACAYRELGEPYRALSDLNKCIAQKPGYGEAYLVKYSIFRYELRAYWSAEAVVRDYVRALLGEPSIWKRGSIRKYIDAYDAIKGSFYDNSYCVFPASAVTK